VVYRQREQFTYVTSDLSANRKVSKDGHVGSAEISAKMPTEVNSRVCAIQRKAGTVTLFTVEQSVLSSPVYRGRIAKYGHVSRISREIKVGILCSEDCVAERQGFEPWVQVLARTTV
jgi:hypothetical protein